MIRRRSLTLPITCLALLAVAGCREQGDVDERTGEPQRPDVAYHDSLSSYGFDRRDEFESQFTAMRAEFNAKAAELETKFSENELTETRRIAMADLDGTRTEFEKLISALPTATAETWQTARDDVNRAWERMQAAYARAAKTFEGSSY